MSEKKQLVIILKNPGTACNIGCIYCAEHRKNYTSVEKKIELEDIENLAKLSKDYLVNVLFHGGEPTLLPIGYYKNITEIFDKYNKDVFYGLQTNGTLINQEWIDFILEYDGKVGISISLDGTREINKNRITRDNKETFDLVKNNIELLSKNGIKTGLISTIVSNTLGKEKELLELLLSFDNLLFVKLNPCFDRNVDGTIPKWGIKPMQYANFVNNMFDLLLQKGEWGRFNLEPIISIFKNLQNVTSSFCNYSFEKCSNFVSVYPDGTVTSCDNYNLQQGELGNLHHLEGVKNIFEFNNNRELVEQYGELMAKCQKCDYREICKGGCIAARIRYKDTDEYCNAIKTMCNHMKEVFKKINENS